MSISSSTNRTSAAPRPAGADPTTAPVQQKAAGAASETAGASKTAAVEAPRSDQFVAAQASGSTSKSLGPSTAKPSRAMDLAKLVKPSESSLLRISETRGPQVAAEMRALDRGIDAKVKDAATVLGPAAQGVAGALSETKNRVIQRLGEGKVNPEEARQALGQIDLLSDGLKAVKEGNLANVRSGGVNLLAPSIKTLQFDIQRGGDTYTMMLRTRPERGLEEGRAGLELSVLTKNGQPLPPGENAALRLEHSVSDQKASVVVSSDVLDKKIHGPKLDANGVAIPGAKASNNEFSAGLPDTLNTPEGFATALRDVQKSAVDPRLEGQAGKSGPYQTDNKVSLDVIGKAQGAAVAEKLGGLNASIDGAARAGAQALGPIGEAVARAVDVTTDRILGRVAQGTLSPADAEKATAQVQVLSTMLQAVKDGKLINFKDNGISVNDPTAKSSKFQIQVGADQYTVNVGSRAEAGQGEARIGFKITEKNGQKLGPLEEIYLRCDLQAADKKVAVDIASAFLDSRVHGPMDIAKTVAGRTDIPDHHFQDGIPKGIEDPATFAKFVNDFRDQYLKKP